MTTKLTYKDAGVDIDSGNKTVDLIKPLAKKTYKKEVISGIGGFNALFKLPEKYKEPVLVSCTDGVGTKLKLAFKTNKHNTIGIDLVAMCVNDLICSGAEPLFFLDYLATGKLLPNTAKEIIEGITEGCRQANCSLIGGETAELPGLYKESEYDLAGFAVGVVEKNKIINGSTIIENDIIIGIESSGLHSNGYSLAQKVIFEVSGWNLNYVHKELNKPIGELLLTPTYIYVNLINELTNKFEIKGIANITGGGLTENIPRILHENLSCQIDLSSWAKPKIFTIIKNSGGIENEEMLRVFNNGIGMIVIIKKEDESKIILELKKSGYKGYKIGRVIAKKEQSNKISYVGNYD